MSTKAVVIILVAFLLIAGSVFFVTRSEQHKSDGLFVPPVEQTQPITPVPEQTPTPTTVAPTPGTEKKCVPTGCSGELCVEEGKEVVTTCVALPEYSCLANYAVCERQSSGKCGWTQTDTYQQCMIEVTGK